MTVPLYLWMWRSFGRIQCGVNSTQSRLPRAIFLKLTPVVAKRADGCIQAAGLDVALGGLELIQGTPAFKSPSR
jgi:hypothetical protein